MPSVRYIPDKSLGNQPNNVPDNFDGKRWRGGRPWKRWTYTVESVAQFAGVTVRAVRSAMHARKRPDGTEAPAALDMDDLLAVARWIERARRRKRPG